MCKDVYISVIVPVYNVEKYLNQCIYTLVHQTFSNIEIIMVDDGSTDFSGVICDSLAEKYDNCKVIHQKNSGLSMARNTGLKNASGNWVMFVDSDDWIDINCLEKCVTCINKFDIDCIIFPYIRELGTESKKVYTLGRMKKIFKDDYVYRRLFGLIGMELKHPETQNDLNYAWGKLYKRKCIGEEIFEPYEISGTVEDLWFNLKVFKNIKTVLYEPDVFYHYNKTNNVSLVHTYHDNFISVRRNLFEMMKKEINDCSLPKEFYKALSNRQMCTLVDASRNIINSDMSFSMKKN